MQEKMNVQLALELKKPIESTQLCLDPINANSVRISVLRFTRRLKFIDLNPHADLIFELQHQSIEGATERGSLVNLLYMT